jgi:dTDP-4-amino-4,6-dideoxygalactose transaminase
MEQRTKERIFSEQFASFNQVPHCVTTPNGTLALRLALEALDVGAGDEVIIPGLTWVATAIAVLSVNAIPVMVDVDPESYCISPAAIREAITPRTKCILPVHFHSAMANMDEIMEISNIYNLSVLEDSAQAHGACWAGRKAGAIGNVGAFSMHNDKLLTCGEGGAVITSDPEIYKRLQALRLDGFDFYEVPHNTIEGPYELAEISDVMGSSCCLSEFQAAVLIEQLKHLANQNAIREQNGLYLDALLDQVDGLTPLKHQPQLELRAFYEYAVRYNSEAFADCSIYAICRALTAELGFPLYPENPPLHQNALYKPHVKKRYFIPEFQQALDTNKYHLPIAESAPDELILFHHRPLLGSQSDMEDIADAFRKIQQYAAELAVIQDQVDNLIEDHSRVQL